MAAIKPPSLTIIQVGTPPGALERDHGDLPVWFARALERSLDDIEICRVFDGDPLPKPDRGRVAIITGSSAMVTERLPWSEATAGWIRAAMTIDKPVFGVCYGHHLMAYALGGVIDYHPRGREIGCITVSRNSTGENDPLIGLPPNQFPAHLTHTQTVIRAPAKAIVLASSDHDSHQVIRYGPKAISTQFHPEMTPAILASIIRARCQALEAEGFMLAGLLDKLEDAAEARRLLRSFVDGSLG